MNMPLIIANILTFLAFFLHTFGGDKELRALEPAANHQHNNSNNSKGKNQETWTMARSGWHWISVDLLFFTIGLGLINFSDFFSASHEKLLLQILALYFFTYAFVWILVIAISKQFPKNYFKLGQWILFIVIASLILFGIA